MDDPYAALRRTFYALASQRCGINFRHITGVYRSGHGDASLCYVTTLDAASCVCLWDDYVAFMHERIGIEDVRRNWPRFR
jgi:hypothetical protein